MCASNVVNFFKAGTSISNFVAILMQLLCECINYFTIMMDKSDKTYEILTSILYGLGDEKQDVPKKRCVGILYNMKEE